MSEALRKITFSLGHYPGFEPDRTEKEEREVEELIRERKGYFHCWTEEETTNPQTGAVYNKKIALVEDATTGKVHKVEYDLIKFEEE